MRCTNTELLENGVVSSYELGLVSYSKKDGAVVNRASKAKGDDTGILERVILEVILEWYLFAMFSRGTLK